MKGNCIYCGGEVRNVAKGEHIVPACIGGKRTISEFCPGRTVCKGCNNGRLSLLDAELCSRSPLSLIAARELDGFIWQSWDVDRLANNLLLEAKPDFAGQAMVVFPQMIFEPSGPELHGDAEEIQRFGVEKFSRVFTRHLRDAFRAHERGEKGYLHLKRVPEGAVWRDRYRYPPRLFTRKPIEEFSEGMSFEFQYASSADKNFALAQLQNWDAAKSFRKAEVRRGSTAPGVRCTYDLGMTWCALAKISLNLVAAFCPNTLVDRTSFLAFVRAIMGETPIVPELLVSNGFVHAADAQPMKVAGAHTFRLLHADGAWTVYSCFFGGSIAARMRFPGQSSEPWRYADITSPINSKEWTVAHGKVLPLVRAPRIEWLDPEKIIPSVGLVNVHSEARLEVIPRKR